MLDAYDIGNADNALWYGLFLFEDLEGTLDRQIKHQHVTFGYGVDVPEGIDWNAVEEIEIVGYGCDDDNEGYSVKLPKHLAFAYRKGDGSVPHVTLSVSEHGMPKNTGDLEFEDLDDPFKVKAKFGYYCDGEYVI